MSKQGWHCFKIIKVYSNGLTSNLLSRNVNCLGDGHDGVGNIIEQIGEKHQRREILDWYHLMENLHKVGGSNQRLKQAKNYLWQGLVHDAIAHDR